MILLAGLRSDDCLRLIERRLRSTGRAFTWFDQLDWERYDLSFTGTALQEAVLASPQARVELSTIAGAYIRMVDPATLLDGEIPGGASRLAHCHNLHTSLRSWLEVSSANVIGRLRGEGSNFSKVFQVQALSKAGFRTPPTHITNVPSSVRDFHSRYPRAIFKSISSTRSIAHELDDVFLSRVELLRGCPVQFQQEIIGTDVRVHVVGSETFATSVVSGATDSRYSSGATDGPQLNEVHLPPALIRQIRQSAELFGLGVAGVDIKLAPSGEATWLEVNPNPGFAWFQHSTGQPIDLAIVRFLSNQYQ